MEPKELFTLRPSTVTQQAGLIVFCGARANIGIFFFKYNGTSIHSFDGSTGVNQSGIAANQLFRAAVSYKSGSRTLSLNGTSPADGSLNTNWSTADRLRIGNGNAVVANMHVKRVIFWPYHKDNL